METQAAVQRKSVEEPFARAATGEQFFLALPGLVASVLPYASRLSCEKRPHLDPSLRRIAKTCGTRLLVHYCERWTSFFRVRLCGRAEPGGWCCHAHSSAAIRRPRMHLQRR